MEEIISVENRYTSSIGEPSLGQALSLLKERWSSGEKDKETALHLLFLVWYSCSEPGFLTGLPELELKPSLFTEVFEYLGSEKSTDPEVCLVVGIMAEVAPWCIGDESYWLNTSKKLKARSLSLKPEGFEPQYFHNRGAYGQYFSHMVSS